MAKKAESGGYARLKGDLAQKTPCSFYVLYGEEDYLRRYYLSMLRRQLVDGPTSICSPCRRMTARSWRRCFPTSRTMPA